MQRPSYSPKWIGASALLLVLTLTWSGCDFQRTVDVDGPKPSPKLVVNGEIIPSRPWRVDVSRSVGAFEPGDTEDSTFTITDATVTVSHDDAEQGPLRLDSLNQYSTRQFTPRVGQKYTVRVTAPELGTVTATDRVPPAPSARLTDREMDPAGPYYDHTLQLTVDDPPDTTNYYHIALRQNVYYRDSTSIDTTGIIDIREFKTRSRSIVNEMGRDAELEDEELNSYSGREATFRDVLFDGTEYQISLQVAGRFSFSSREARVEYILYLSALSEDTYQFLRTSRLQSRVEENPFAEPVEVHSNVEDGYGVVGARNVDTLRAEVEVP